MVFFDILVTNPRIMFEKITQENVLNVLEKQLDQEQYRKLEKISNPSS